MATVMDPGSVGLSHVYLSPDEVAAAIPGITKNTLAMWRYEGKGPRYRKLGRVVVYALDELEAWIEAGARDCDQREH
jgi:predicted DNA-binding transcriptional regulator AlpA